MASAEWTDALKQELVDAYVERNPTSENTMDIVKDLAQEFEKTANGVRLVLTRAGVYVKKEGAATASGSTSKSSGTTGEAGKRVNKAEAIQSLKDKIGEKGQPVDDDICDRLTGKAAVYILGIIVALNG